MKELESLLISEAKKLDLDKFLSQEKIEKLVQFIELLYKWNNTYNLTSIREPKAMLEKHVLDSLAVAPYITENCYADAGSGPGLPGIPLAIIFPEKKFYLIESLGKKINFQREVKRSLKLDNIFPTQERCEKFVPNEPIDCVLSRAFASIPDMLSFCQKIPKENGYFYALKGDIPTSELKVMSQDFEVSDIIALNVPKNLGQRHLIVIKKKVN